jgi:hypothetical protein
VTALAGIVFAVAWLIHGRSGWWISIVTLVVTAARVFALYRAGNTDSDEGALAASRADERQRMVSLRSWALSGGTAMAAAFIGLAVATAARSAAWWPFLIVLLVAGFGYLLGLSNYGAGEPDPDPEA